MSLPQSYLQYSHFNWALGSARSADLDWRCSPLALRTVQYIAEVLTVSFLQYQLLLSVSRYNILKCPLQFS